VDLRRLEISGLAKVKKNRGLVVSGQQTTKKITISGLRTKNSVCLVCARGVVRRMVSPQGA
jgi:hypothetical protein